MNKIVYFDVKSIKLSDKSNRYMCVYVCLLNKLYTHYPNRYAYKKYVLPIKKKKKIQILFIADLPFYSLLTQTYKEKVSELREVLYCI